ncbi:MAG: SDR family NAD(P)-dependent oxidoreductase [Vicinamibacterales bacterium]
MTDAGELRGQVAVVTGAGRGLGRAYATTLARAGATVALVARTATEIEDAAAEIARDGGVARAFPADVTTPGALAPVIKALGPVDLLVNNAGLRGPIGPFWDADPAEYWRAIDVNLRGPILCTRAVLPAMIARRRGRVINLASGAAAMPIAYFSSYCAAKSALVRMTECLAIEARPHGVCLFSITPGSVRTSMTEYSLTSEAGLKWLPWYKQFFDEGLNLTPEHSAALVRRLASGRYDVLSGLMLSPLDDLDAIAQEIGDVKAGRLYSLRLRRPGPDRPNPILEAAERARDE